MFLRRAIDCRLRLCAGGLLNVSCLRFCVCNQRCWRIVAVARRAESPRRRVHDACRSPRSPRFRDSHGSRAEPLLLSAAPPATTPATGVTASAALA